MKTDELQQNEMVQEALEAKEQGEPNYSAAEVLDYARSRMVDRLPSL